MKSAAMLAVALLMSLSAAAQAQPALNSPAVAGCTVSAAAPEYALAARAAHAAPGRAAFARLTAAAPEAPDSAAGAAQPTAAPTAIPATAAPTAVPTAAPTALPTAEPTAAPVDGLQLNLESLSVELPASQSQCVCVAELELLGLPSGVSVDWYVSSRLGESVAISLKTSGTGRADVYALPQGVGESEFELTARCSNGVDFAEYTASVIIAVAPPAVELPARIEGVDIIYNMVPAAKLTIAPSNAPEFPSGTTWQLTERSGDLFVAQDGHSFTVSAAVPGRYVALMTARTPGGAERMAYMMFVVGEDTPGVKPALNFSELDIVLDIDRATGEAEFFIRPDESLGYVPTRWTLSDGGSSVAALTLIPQEDGALLRARPISEGETERQLRCEMPSLGAKVVLPVRVTVRRSDDPITGVTLRRPDYSMRLSEALTLAPYALPEGLPCPDGTTWTVSQQGGPEGCLVLTADAATGQTTIMATRPGVYPVEFAARISANRVYTTSVTLTVTE